MKTKWYDPYHMRRLNNGEGATKKDCERIWKSTSLRKNFFPDAEEGVEEYAFYLSKKQQPTHDSSTIHAQKTQTIPPCAHTQNENENENENTTPTSSQPLRGVLVPGKICSSCPLATLGGSETLGSVQKEPMKICCKVKEEMERAQESRTEIPRALNKQTCYNNKEKPSKVDEQQ